MTNLENLNHIEIDIKNGGKVFILNKGETIDSEAEAMLQALHSRSVGGFKNHLEILKKRGAQNFMSQFYVGYGHKSIGDCGSITIFIEGVSMLAAKAIQDSKLYNGQEASTRYIDFSKQKMISPLEKYNSLLEKQRKFYLDMIDPIQDFLKKEFPLKEQENEKIYLKAIAAKSFDITRGLLPAGTSTNLAWHSNLRQVADKLIFLENHPLEEVKEIGHSIKKAVLKKYPNSFKEKEYEETKNYQKIISKNYYYHNINQKEFEVEFDNFDKKKIEENTELINSRPNNKTELPQYLHTLGEVGFSFLLDFGSFRDLQRHRAINQRMPLLTTKLGYNKFYLIELPIELKQKIEDYLKNLKQEIDSIENIDEKVRQYYIPMGFNMSNYITGSLPSLVYLSELRSTKFVHISLRVIARKMAKYLVSKNIKVMYETTDDRFDVKRGEHDIELN